MRSPLTILALVDCAPYSSWPDTVSPRVYAPESKRADSAPVRCSMGDAEPRRLETHLGEDWQE